MYALCIIMYVYIIICINIIIMFIMYHKANLLTKAVCIPDALLGKFDVDKYVSQIPTLLEFLL